MPPPSVPRELRRSKFQNYTAVTLGLEGEEGDRVSARLWDAVDGQLKKEVGPGVDCLLTRVKSRCVFASMPVCKNVCTFWADSVARVTSRESCRVNLFVYRDPFRPKPQFPTKLLSAFPVDGPTHGMCIAWIKTRRGWWLWLLRWRRQGKCADSSANEVSVDQPGYATWDALADCSRPSSVCCCR